MAPDALSHDMPPEKTSWGTTAGTIRGNKSVARTNSRGSHSVTHELRSRRRRTQGHAIAPSLNRRLFVNTTTYSLRCLMLNRSAAYQIYRTWNCRGREPGLRSLIQAIKLLAPALTV